MLFFRKIYTKPIKVSRVPLQNCKKLCSPVQRSIQTKIIFNFKNVPHSILFYARVLFIFLRVQRWKKNLLIVECVILLKIIQKKKYPIYLEPPFINECLNCRDHLKMVDTDTPNVIQ